jgi:hypothetical protein
MVPAVIIVTRTLTATDVLSMVLITDMYDPKLSN